MRHFVWADLFWKVPASHSTQCAEDTTDMVVSPDLPGGHALHVFASDAPLAELNVPVGHGSQPIWFVSRSTPYLPVGHSVEQLSKGASDVFPSSHDVHSVDPVLLACCPRSHCLQLVLLLAANWVLYFPRSHSKHWSLFVAAFTLLYFPGAH